MVKAKQASVLIFDSGVGGLSVFDEIQAVLPQVDYYYLFDNAAYPYGELEQAVLINRATKLIKYFVEWHQIDLVVIACNTASTILLPTLREVLSIPVVGVVPAIKPASHLANKAIGLIATPATVTRPYIKDLIRDFAKNKSVELLGSTRLVEMAENKLRSETVDLKELNDILAPLKGKIDVAVLGCTHFPLLKEEISIVLGSAVILVDSGEAIARRVKQVLKFTVNNTNDGKREIYSSATPYKKRALEQSLVERGFNALQDCPFEI